MGWYTKRTVLNGSILLTLALFIYLSLVQNDKKAIDNKSKSSIPTSSIVEFDNPNNRDDALKLMVTYCYACHTHEGVGGRDNRLAPPMYMIRNHYYSDEITKDEFIQSVTDFVKSPSESTALMRGAIRNFGLMPPLPLPDEILVPIATYIYENDLRSDEWRQKFDEFKKSN